KMLLKNMINAYHLLLALGAFYLGASMLLEKGVFASFPQEWIGIMPFNSWASLALFGIIIFGMGNAIASIYGFIKKDNNIFIITIAMGALFFSCALLPFILLGEWYLPMAQFFILSSI